MCVLDLYGNWNLYTKPASGYVAVLVNAVFQLSLVWWWFMHNTNTLLCSYCCLLYSFVAC